MLFDLVDTLQKRRRFIFVAMFVLLDFWVLTFCTQLLQSHRADFAAHIHNAQVTQNQINAQAALPGTDNVSVGMRRMSISVEVGVLRATIATANGITATEHAVGAASLATVHAIGAAASATGHATLTGLAFTGHIIAWPFVQVGHGVGYAFGATSRLTSSHLASVIQPKTNAAVPVITAQQAQQAELIQSGTLSFEPVKTSGSGGACDNGVGNGGYPMEWCDSPMDSIRTISYSSDHINRECTSYAYWYFTNIEGHWGFHVTGNANRWAYTSNYPVHRTPAVGAIAVETAGAYGHVAIVQALPGQSYDGQVVPSGYVLVSEMNYDWRGHFRYSYSPLEKFSAFIYQ